MIPYYLYLMNYILTVPDECKAFFEELLKVLPFLKLRPLSREQTERLGDMLEAIDEIKAIESGKRRTRRNSIRTALCAGCVATVSMSSEAQDPHLDFALGTTAQTRSITQDQQGNTYAAGYFTGICDFDPGVGIAQLDAPSREDIFVLKLDPQGTFLWAAQFETVGSCLVGNNANTTCGIDLDDQGNIIVAGMFDCPMDFDPGPGLLQLDPNSGAAFVVKLDPVGGLIWARSFGNASIRPYDLLVKGDEIITIGVYNGTGDFDPGPGTSISSGQWEGFVQQLDQNGDFVSVLILEQLSSGGGVYPMEVCRAGVDDIVVGGGFSGTIDFDPTGVVSTMSSIGGSDGFVCRLSATGAMQWAKRLGGLGDDYVNGIALDVNDELVFSGWFDGTVDFDPGPGSYMLTSGDFSDIFISRWTGNGDMLWTGSFGEDGPEYIYALDLDLHGNVFILGVFAGSVDFDPGAGTYLVDSGGGTWGYIGKWDRNGRVIWAVPYGGTGYDILALTGGGVLSCGSMGFPVDFDPSEAEYYVPVSVGSYVWALNEEGVLGSVWHDVVPDCIETLLELGLSGRIIEVQPGGILATTNTRGFWHIDSLPPGSYTATVDQHRGPWQSLCTTTHAFVVPSTEDQISVETFGLTSTQPCAAPEISLYTPVVRRCFGAAPFHVLACNQGTGTAIIPSATVEVQLDSAWELMNASLPYSLVGVNRFQFQVGDIWPGQCIAIVLDVTVDCSAELNTTICASAELFPVAPCALDTIAGPGDCTTAWDGSSIKVDSYCLNDTVYFTILNVAALGVGDMTCYSAVRVYLDDVLVEVDSVMLLGGESYTFAFPGNGQTWRVEADQHPLHPGNSQPVSVQERCGNPGNWTPGLVATRYMNDADPVIDIFCGQVRGSFDPNDKIGYPTGYSDEHYINPDQQLQYVIRFQNTGNDTAFTVVVRDTLSQSLDVLSFVPGIASHPFTFRMYGPRVVEWTFENIELPDSTTNFLGSLGFVTYRIDPVNGLQDGTNILNQAAIYFDFNEPIVTPPTIHVVNELDDLILPVVSVTTGDDLGLSVFPNPTRDEAVVVGLPRHDSEGLLSVHDLYGKLVTQVAVSPSARTLTLGIGDVASGLYLIQFACGSSAYRARFIRQ